MGDLARRRNARELWISRNHLWAAGAVFVFALGAAFGVGYLLGRGDVQAPARPGFTENVGGGDLVEVLARVDANVRTDGGVQDLTFPDALTAPVEGDLAPPGRFTIEVARFGAIETARPLRDHLRQAGLGGWIGVERVDGVSAYLVSVGGYADESGATAALQPVVDAVASFDGASGIPHVVDRGL